MSAESPSRPSEAIVYVVDDDLSVREGAGTVEQDIDQFRERRFHSSTVGVSGYSLQSTARLRGGLHARVERSLSYRRL